MRKLNLIMSLLGVVSAMAVAASAQDLPAVTGPPTNQGFTLPDPLTGGLRYGLTGSESVRFGYNGASRNVYVSSFSGDLGYSSGNARRPTGVVYAGGYLHTSGQNSNDNIRASSTFQSLSVTQGLSVGRWGLNFADKIQYLPQAPTTGLSGIPGIGDVGIGLPTGGLGGQDILTRYGQRVNNLADGSVGRSLTGRTSVQASGSYTVQRFVDDSGGLSSNGMSGSGGLNYSLNALNSLGASYSYSRFSYPGSTFDVASQSIQGHYSRQINRRLRIGVGGGPMKTSSSVPELGAGGWNVAASANADYAARNSSFILSFSRQVRSGSGVVRGALSTTVSLAYSRALGRSSSVSADGGYAQNDSFKTATVPFSIRSVVAAVQARRALSRSFSTYVSYSVQKQILNGSTVNVNTYSGFNQVIGFGVTYSPPMIHLSRK